MSDSVKAWHEMSEENKVSTSVDRDLILVNKLLALSNEQKLLDIDQALKEYKDNDNDASSCSNKWHFINRIEKIML